MTTLDEVTKAEAEARKQRQENCRDLLRLDESRATDDEVVLAFDVMDAARAEDGGKSLDEVLARPGVVLLFMKGVLRFERVALPNGDVKIWFVRHENS